MKRNGWGDVEQTNELQGGVWAIFLGNTLHYYSIIE